MNLRLYWGLEETVPFSYLIIEMISSQLLVSIYQKLGIPIDIPENLEGLTKLYQAWCFNVPFDNIRKMSALFNSEPGALPGAEADDFFNSWLEHGTGGTCWAGSNALFSLLSSTGFEARRISGSMMDIGFPNHGSIIVTLEGKEYLLDSSILSNHPIQIYRDKVLIEDFDPLIHIETDPTEDMPIIWFRVPNVPSLVPCRLLHDPVNLEYYLSHYENSRTNSPFNQKLHIRKNFSEKIQTIHGCQQHTKTKEGVQVKELSSQEVKNTLLQDFGISEFMVEHWAASGALEASMEPGKSFGPPPFSIRPPSSKEG